jgi:hypothetical protein
MFLVPSAPIRHTIDFQKPWWYPLFLQKKLLSLLVINKIVNSIYQASFIFVVGLIIASGNINFIWLLVIALILECMLELWRSRLNTSYQFGVVHSLKQSAQRLILETDPVVHSTKSSGKIIAKVASGTDTYHNIMYIMVFQVCGWLIQLITVSTTLLYYNVALGLASMVGLTIICGVSGLLHKSVYSESKDVINTTREKSITTMVQNIAQVQLIRSTFQTKFRQQLLKADTLSQAMAVFSRWIAMNTTILVTLVLYALNLMLVFFWLLHMVQTNALDQTIGVALLTNYIINSAVATQFGRMVRGLSHSITKASDLFDALRNFGTTTYPSHS